MCLVVISLWNVCKYWVGVAFQKDYTYQTGLNAQNVNSLILIYAYLFGVRI